MDNFIQNIIAHWGSFDVSIALLIFVAYTILDALFAKYTFEVTELNEYRSATTGAIMLFFLRSA